jgi:hypothetical protein
LRREGNFRFSRPCFRLVSMGIGGLEPEKMYLLLERYADVVISFLTTSVYCLYKKWPPPSPPSLNSQWSKRNCVYYPVSSWWYNPRVNTTPILTLWLS